MAVNLYKLLGVKQTATTAEIRAAIDAAEQAGRLDSSMLSAARQALLNPVMRQKYDARLQQDVAPTGGTRVSVSGGGAAAIAYREPQISEPWITKFGIALALLCLVIGYFVGHTHAMYQSAKVMAKAKQNTDAPQKAESEPPAKKTDVVEKPTSTQPVEIKMDNASIIERRDAEVAQQARDFDDKVKSAVASTLKDPDSAQFKIDVRVSGVNVKQGDGSYVTNVDVVCGSVNAKNSYGGYVGFRRFVWMSHTPDVLMERGTKEDYLNDKLVDLGWDKYCLGK